MPLPLPLPQLLGNACGRHSTLAMLSFFILRSAPEKFVYVEKSNIPSRTRIIIIIVIIMHNLIIISISISISNFDFASSILMLMIRQLGQA